MSNVQSVGGQLQAAVDQLVESMLSSTPVKGATAPPGTLTAYLGPAPAAPSPLLPDPAAQLMMGGDPGAMVAALVIETAKSEKDIANKVDQTETAIQEQEQKAQVAAMHQKADDMRAQAWVTGGMGLASAGLSFAGASYEFHSTEARQFDAASKGMTAVGGAVQGQFAAQNEDTDATVATHEHNAADAGRAASQAYDNGRDAKKLLDAAIDFYREYSSAAEQTKAAAVHRG